MNITDKDKSNNFWGVKEFLRTIEIIVQYRKLFIGMFTLLMSTFLLYILFATPLYRAEVSLLPEIATDKNVLQSLALTTGNIGGRQKPSQSILYEPILLSNIILTKIVYQKYIIPSIKSDYTLIRLFNISGDNSEEMLENALDMLRNKIKITIDRKTGVVRISIETFNPNLSSMIINALVNELDAFLRNQNRTRAQENKDFINERLLDTKDLLNSAEENLRSFRESNKRIEKSPDLQLVQARLLREVRIQEEVYLTLKKELEITKIEEVKNMQLVKILDVAVPPVFKSKPKRKQLFQFGLIISLFVSSMMALFTGFFINILSDEKYIIMIKKITDPLKSDYVNITQRIKIYRRHDDS